MAQPASDFRYDPYSIEAMTDPLPLYRRLRQDWPAYPLSHYHSWAISRFADIWTVFRDRERFSDAEGQVFPRPLLEAPLPATVPTAPLEPLAIFNNLDPPLHTLVRRALGASLLPNAVAKFETMLRKVTADRRGAFAPLSPLRARCRRGRAGHLGVPDRLGPPADYGALELND